MWEQARFWDIRCITHHKQILAGIAKMDNEQTEQRDGARGGHGQAGRWISAGKSDLPAAVRILTVMGS